MEKPSVLKELYIGIGIVVLFFMIIGIIVMRPFWIFGLGLIVGAIGAGIWLYSMYDVLNRALDLGKKDAKTFMAARSILRLFMVMAFMGVALYIHWNAFVGVAVGLLSLKVSALLNPFIKKYITKTAPIRNDLIIEADIQDSEDKSTDNKR